MAKKSMVLSGEGNKKAVLTIETDGEDLKGRVRLYNFPDEPSGIISLGLCSQGKVTKAGLTKVSSMLYSFQALNETLPEKFSCAIVNITGAESAPILYGNSEGKADGDEIYGAVINSLQSDFTVQGIEKVLDENGIDYDDELKREIDEKIEEEFEGNTCAKCKYREYFYANCASKAQGQETLEETPIKEKPQGTTFYDEVKGQVEKLFEQNAAEEYLQKLIPGSKWVKVEYEKSGDYYVFGLLYEDDKLKYLCYGVPGVYQATPPRQLSGYPVWFPLDEKRKEGFGYWLTYQDAESGESVKAIVE